MVPEFEPWNYEDAGKLAREKLGTVSDEGIFFMVANEHFTPY